MTWYEDWEEALQEQNRLNIEVQSEFIANKIRGGEWEVK